MKLSKHASTVLYAVYTLQEQGGATRRSIARSIDASMVIVSRALGELEKGGFIDKNPMSQDRGGRPLYLYSVRPGCFSSIGIAFQADSVVGVLVDSNKQVLKEASASVNWSDNGDETPQIIARSVRSILSELQSEPAGTAQAGTLGVSMPGIVDSRSGTWVRGLQIPGVSRIDIPKALEFTGLEIHTEDYTRALAFYEMTTGAGRDVSDFSLVNLGLGVGSSLVIRRKIYRGMHGLAGEIGHIIVDPNGRRCGCGMVGCLETVCSVPGIIESIGRFLEAGVVSEIKAPPNELSVSDLVVYLESGDRLVSTVISEATEALVTGLATLTKISNPQRIIVTGPGSVLFSSSLQSILGELKLQILPEMEQDLELVFSDYQANQEARGAALLATDRYWPGKATPPADRIF